MTPPVSRTRSCNASPRYELPEVSERCALHVKSEKPCSSLRVSDNANPTQSSPHLRLLGDETRRIERKHVG